jgi:hypothetical protein
MLPHDTLGDMNDMKAAEAIESDGPLGLGGAGVHDGPGMGVGAPTTVRNEAKPPALALFAVVVPPPVGVDAKKEANPPPPPIPPPP